jgi:hypothetical protein
MTEQPTYFACLMAMVNSKLLIVVVLAYQKAFTTTQKAFVVLLFLPLG